MPAIARADTVGSLLRPAYLREARQGRHTGSVSDAELRAAEDRAVREAIALQEAAGLDVINDGELRRGTWIVTTSAAGKPYVPGPAEVQAIFSTQGPAGLNTVQVFVPVVLA